MIAEFLEVTFSRHGTCKLLCDASLALARSSPTRRYTGEIVSKRYYRNIQRATTENNLLVPRQFSAVYLVLNRSLINGDKAIWTRKMDYIHTYSFCIFD